MAKIVGPMRLLRIGHVRIGKAFLIRATHGGIFDKNHMRYIYSPITNPPPPPPFLVLYVKVLRNTQVFHEFYSHTRPIVWMCI